MFDLDKKKEQFSSLFSKNKEEETAEPAPEPKESPAAKNSHEDIADDVLEGLFRAVYEPHRFKNYDIQPRTDEEIEKMTWLSPELRQMMLDIDMKRLEDPMAGTREASNAIQEILVPLVSDGKTLDPALYLAVLGALGGWECAKGLMSTLAEMVGDDDNDRVNKILSTGQRLGICVASKNDDLYLFGDMLNECAAFSSFISFQEHYQTVSLPCLDRELNTLLDNVGTPRYWDVSHLKYVRQDPRVLVRDYRSHFEAPLAVCCRHPSERMTAFAGAVQLALEAFTKEGLLTIEEAAAIVTAYFMRIAHSFSDELRDAVDGRKNSSRRLKTDEVMSVFIECYAPYTKPGFRSVPRTEEQFPETDPSREKFRFIAMEIDKKRADDPYFGIKLGYRELFIKVEKYLGDILGFVHAETLLAVLGAIGGKLISKGIVESMDSMIADDVPDRDEVRYRLAPLLDIMIAETDGGERYLMGNLVGSESMVFLNNAASESLDPNDFTGLADTCAGLIGTADYWETGDELKADPRRLADMFLDMFEDTFRAYCRYPQERMLTAALAAQEAVTKAVGSGVITKDKAIGVLADHLWRNSHYIGRL